MAQVINAQANQVKLNNGQVVNAQTGGWYDGQQYWGGSLSNAGVINASSNQQGAGQAVSKEVVAQTNPNNVAYLQQQNAQAAPGAGSAGGDSGATGTSGGGGGSGAGVGFQAPATINLPGLFDSYSKEEGIPDLQTSITAKTQAFNDAQSKINDNPFLSESNRTGRIQKLSNDYNNNIKNDQDSLAMKQADVQTRLGLQTQQFNINSQASQQALSQFQTLLESGALNNASGQDIANITTATGLSSSMIQSAVKAQAAKNTQTSVIPFDDGTNQGYAVINTQTGQVINKQIIGASKPTSSGGSGGKTDSNGLTQSDYISYLSNDIKNKVTLKSLVGKYCQYLTDAQILQLYNQDSPWGTATDKNGKPMTVSDIQKGLYND